MGCRGMRVTEPEAAVGATLGIMLSLTVAGSGRLSGLLCADVWCCLLRDMAADDDELHGRLCEGLQGWRAAADHSRWRYGRQDSTHTHTWLVWSSPALSLHVSTHTDQRGSAQLCPKSSSKHLLPPWPRYASLPVLAAHHLLMTAVLDTPCSPACLPPCLLTRLLACLLACLPACSPACSPACLPACLQTLCAPPSGASSRAVCLWS